MSSYCMWCGSPLVTRTGRWSINSWEGGCVVGSAGVEYLMTSLCVCGCSFFRTPQFNRDFNSGNGIQSLYTVLYTY